METQEEGGKIMIHLFVDVHCCNLVVLHLNLGISVGRSRAGSARAGGRIRMSILNHDFFFAVVVIRGVAVGRDRRRGRLRLALVQLRRRLRAQGGLGHRVRAHRTRLLVLSQF